MPLHGGPARNRDSKVIRTDDGFLKSPMNSTQESRARIVHPLSQQEGVKR